MGHAHEDVLQAQRKRTTARSESDGKKRDLSIIYMEVTFKIISVDEVTQSEDRAAVVKGDDQESCILPSCLCCAFLTV